MKIRQLSATDAVDYRDVRLEALKNNPEAFSSSFEEELEYGSEVYEGRLSHEHIYTFGAFVENRLVGTVTLICETKKKIKHRATVVAMYVLPEQRKSGVGKALMNEAITKAKELKDIEQIYLAVTANNEPAKRLYNSLGFDTYGVDKNGLKIGDAYFDEDLMVLTV
ncbi:GNAT family N-acetyltransferase [Sutcliffiella horikoshii]|uniref:GNAT family N-acetyltransferase n=1 Tax=Sutcliffiella horikoshii TaxID=79883 RepID=UPI001F34C6BB|nr:GNAT family N-acetyltransferase [Sutcliffiella horikoshii]MCG1023228.1 GNAT family N-acetyltransferase [Sutcliffiella horikoshii]